MARYNDRYFLSLLFENDASLRQNWSDEGHRGKPLAGIVTKTLNAIAVCYGILPMTCLETGSKVRCYIKSGRNSGAWYRPVVRKNLKTALKGWPAKDLECVLYALAFSHLPHFPSDPVTRFEQDVFRIEVQFAHRHTSDRDYLKLLGRIKAYAQPGRISKIKRFCFSKEKAERFRSLGEIVSQLNAHPNHKALELALFDWHRSVIAKNTTVRLPNWLSDMAWLILKRAVRHACVWPDRTSLHSLRKTFAMAMWVSPQVGHDMAKMARLLGHKDFSNTLRYLQFLDNSLEDAVIMAA